MGRLKDSLIAEQEARFNAMDKQSCFAFYDDSDAPSPSWELEFNEWLDRYEQSFGNREDLS